MVMVGQRSKANGRPSSPASFQHANGAVFVPISTPPSWLGQYFYVVSDPDELSGPVEPLRCLRLAERDVRRCTNKVTAHNAKEDVKDAARTMANKTEGLGTKLSNAVEDLIPGDSDGDGH